MIQTGISSRSRSVAVSLNFIVSLVLLTECWRSAHASCYYPDGTEMIARPYGKQYAPCNPSNEHSMCCGLSREVPAPDLCQSDGLCFAPWNQRVWRDGCTDPTWRSPACIKLCIAGIGKSTSSSKSTHVFESRWVNFNMVQEQYNQASDLSMITAIVTPCIDGSYCCGNGTLAETCCSEKQGVFVIDGNAIRVNVDEISQTVSATLASKTFSTLSTFSTSSTSSTSSRASLTVSSSHLISVISARDSPQGGLSSSTLLISSASSTSSRASLTVSSSHHGSVISAQVSPPGRLSSSTSSASASSISKSSDKTGVIVGGTIGGVAVVVVAIIGIILVLKLHHFENHSLQMKSKGEKSDESSKTLRYLASKVEVSGPLVELEQAWRLHELEDPRMCHEMQ